VSAFTKRAAVAIDARQLSALGKSRESGNNRRSEMKVCPIAVVAGCEKCPFFRICPAKGVLGGYQKPPPVKVTPVARKPRTSARKKA
jgi:hypothetical protein